MSRENISMVTLSDSAYDILWYLVNATYGYGEKVYRTELPNIQDLLPSLLGELSVLSTAVGAVCVIAVSCVWSICRKLTQSKKADDASVKRQVLQLIKKASIPGCTQTIIEELGTHNVDVNEKLTPSGLTFFLFACLSGDADLIQYMIQIGGDVKAETTEGDSALYLATFAVVVHHDNPDTRALRLLIDAGCSVNKANKRGYTPLHRAASRGNIKVIQFLLLEGADPYMANSAGVYPIDSAICAGHREAAGLLRVQVKNPHVWDVVDPHTPPHILLGLQSPLRHAMLQSRPPRPSLRTVFT